MVELEIDGKKVEVPEGSMVMDAATQLGLYVPHFCYHKKLSIAANCRMCLVEVEKAPKPLPACATPVTAGMKVFTHSEKARQAQKSVMEFLLINHPLDCPICDQGGECQLQDLAVGYGPSASRYTEEKRVVFHKPMGPLISAEEMSRCIHCTRCVRFGQEIAGVMELGMAGRGEHSEIMSFVGGAVQSELSGNMIDVCPVGALTSKPFRYSARTWELSRKRSVSPHDSIGANIVVQSKGSEVKRVVPFENEAVNECWISDRDRFSYEGLSGAHRLTTPMMKRTDGSWAEISWEEALAKAAQAMKTASGHGPNQVRALISPNSTLEEMSLLASLTRSLKSDAVDFRPRLGQVGFDKDFVGVPTLGMRLSEVSHLDRALIVGSSLRNDHPLLAQRLRQAARHGAQVMRIHAVAEDWAMPIAEQMLASPADWSARLAEIAVAAAALKSMPVPAAFKGVTPTSAASAIAHQLVSSGDPAQQAAILLGNAVMAHPAATVIWANAQQLALIVGCRIGFTVDGANGVGGYLAKANPVADGPNAAAMFTQAAECYLLVNIDPAMDCANPHQAKAALKSATTVIALSAFKDGVMDVADLVLPIAPFTETSGSYVNCEGRLQTTQAVVKPLGQARPGWKVLRVLGNLVDVPGFDFESSEEIRAQLMPKAQPGEVIADLRVSVTRDPSVDGQLAASPKSQLVRFGSVPIYRADVVVRQAPALQETAASAPPRLEGNPSDLARLGLATGMKARCYQSGKASALLDVVADDRVAPGVVKIASAHGLTSDLGDLIGPIEVEAA
jgi:NADH-quinone oxidoreductase subunit G